MFSGSTILHRRIVSIPENCTGGVCFVDGGFSFFQQNLNRWLTPPFDRVTPVPVDAIQPVHMAPALLNQFPRVRCMTDTTVKTVQIEPLIIDVGSVVLGTHEKYEVELRNIGMRAVTVHGGDSGAIAR